MRVKSYYAATVPAAMEQARAELGCEAMILQSRRTPPERQSLGEYEVVCALLPEPDASPQAAAPGGPDPLREELTQMRRYLDAMRRELAGSAAMAGGEPSWPAPLASLYARMIGAGIERGLAGEIASAAHARRGNGLRAVEAVAKELGRRCQASPTLGRRRGQAAAVALVGPPGSGKTTTLVKLAVTLGLARRRRVQLVSTDNYRIFGADQLRHFASILGVPFRGIENPRDLEEVLAEPRPSGLLFIDTPGLAPGEREPARELAAVLAGHPDIETHLTLPAGTNSADLFHAAERFACFRPARLVFTRIDETDSFGTAFSLAAALALPVSFLGTGQRIPEDLEPATVKRIVELVLGKTDRRMQTAA